MALDIQKMAIRFEREMDKVIASGGEFNRRDTMLAMATAIVTSIQEDGEVVLNGGEVIVKAPNGILNIPGASVGKLK